MSVIDFPNIDISSGGEIYPEGLYKVQLKEHQFTKASTGTEQVRWYAEILDGPYKGKTIVEHIPLSSKAAWRVASFVYNTGIDTKSLPKLQTGSESFNRVIKSCEGRSMYWYVIQDTYNGKVNNKVSEYKRLEEYEDVDGDTVDLDDIPDFLKG